MFREKVSPHGTHERASLPGNDESFVSDELFCWSVEVAFAAAADAVGEMGR